MSNSRFVAAFIMASRPGRLSRLGTALMVGKGGNDLPLAALGYSLQLQPLVFDGLVPGVGADSQIKGNAFRLHHGDYLSNNAYTNPPGLVQGR